MHYLVYFVNMKYLWPAAITLCLLSLFLWLHTWQRPANSIAASPQASSTAYSAPPNPLASLSASPALVDSHTPTRIPKTRPASVNISVPFTVQAPTGRWDAFHEETCEEAAALMAAYWRDAKLHRSLGDPAKIPNDTTETALRAIADWETQTFGYWQDTTATETAEIITDYFHLQASVETIVSTDTIEQALADGHLVLLPTAGRLLNSPYYTAPGPAYHFLLIRGYTNTDFITNDAGTKYGAGYQFRKKTVLQAIHDWTGDAETITTGRSVMIVVQ